MASRRADYGAGTGWTSNRADHGVIVNSDNVKAQEVIWKGQHGEMFFQDEMSSDPPSQGA